MATSIQLPIRSAPESSKAVEHVAVEQIVRQESRLMSLPVELQEMILDNLILNSDEKNACLACKRFQAFLTPDLYRHMEVDGDYVRDASFARSLTGEHHGLKHVRTLRICDPKTLVDIGIECARTFPRTESPEEEILEEQMARVVCDFLRAMPKHSLTRLELPMYYCRSTGVERLVRLSQHALTNYQLRASKLEILQIIAPDPDNLCRITTLQLYVQFKSDYQHTLFLLDSTPNLMSLDIELLMDSPEVAFPSVSLAGGPRKLRALRLECWYFDNGGTTLFQMVRFEELEELQIFYCRDYGRLLLELAHLTLKLKSFCIDEQDTAGIQFDDNTNMFLRSLNPLDRIALALDADLGGLDTPIDWSAIEIHASTLKYLKVEINWVADMFPTKECISSLVRLCNNAVNLEQLAVSGVDSEFDDEGISGNISFYQFLDCIAELRSLRVLKLNVWLRLWGFNDYEGDAPRSRPQLDARATERQRVIQEIVDKIFWFAENVCPDLAVIVIGTYGHEAEDEEICCFLRSKPIVVNGELTPVGVPVKKNMVKYHEPCSDIVEREAFGFTKMRPALEMAKRGIPWARNNT